MHMTYDLIMDSSTVTSLHAKNQASRHDQDRISGLPDPIIHHIFSFLKAEVVAQSSILSKRWRNLWASLPFLHLDEHEFEDGDSFAHFVDMFLRLRDPSDVHTLRLTISSHSYNHWKHSVCSWIFHAVRHNIRVLQVRVYDSRSYTAIEFLLPNCIFTCRSLEILSLKLLGCTNARLQVRLSRFTDLLKLKSLYLEELHTDQNLVERILSACPLQDLHLKCCQFETLDISSPTLKRLTMDECQAGLGIRISTPTLVDLKVNHGDCAVTFVQNLPSLVTAAIGEIVYFESGDTLFKIGIVTALSNVESLKFYFSWDKCSAEDFSQIPTFHNLKNLTLGGRINVQVVAHFLQHSPNLEKLLLHYTEGYYQNTHDWETIWKSGELSFVCQSLKVVEIRFQRNSYNNTNGVLQELMNYFFANVQLLQN